MEYDFSGMSDEELDRALASAQASAPSQSTQKPFDASAMSDEELDAALASVASGAPRMTREERIAQNQRAIERAQQPGEGEGGIDDVLLEGARGAGRAVKDIGGGIVGMVSGAARLAGTSIRMATGWEGLHKLADSIDESYANFGADALMSEYGENPDGWLNAAGRFGEKLAGTAGSLAALASPGGVAKAGTVALSANASRAAKIADMAARGIASIPGARTGAAIAEKSLPFMFGNDAAVRAYDTARANGKSKSEAAALASMNGAIHFIGFQMFKNKSLNKMLGMPAEMEAMMPKWAGEAMESSVPQSFTSMVRGMRNGMIKYTLAERGKGALRAGGIMAVQNMLSDIPMQVAEGGDWGDLDFTRIGKKGLEGLEEGAIMEGALGAAALLKSPKAAREFVSDKLFRNGYDVVAPDGRKRHEPGLLNSSEGRMLLMKQNPVATERVLDIVEHGGKPRPEELDAAFLPPDMSEAELKRFASDWRKDLEPYVDEAMNADQPTRPAPPAETVAEAPRFEPLTAEEAKAQEEATSESAEKPEVSDRRKAADSLMLDFESYSQLYRDGKTDMSFDEWRAAGKPGVIEANLSEPAKAESRNGGEQTLPESIKPTGEANETRNEADEAPAQPEEGAAVRPAETEAPRPVEAEPQGAEAPDAGVVEPPPAQDRAGVAAEPAGARPAPETDKETPVAEKPVEAAPEPIPVAEEPKPEEPAPTNRLKRADGTDPLAEKETAQAAEPAPEQKQGGMSPTQKRNRLNKIQGILNRIEPDSSLDPKAFRYGENNPGGLKLGDLKMLDDPANDGWQYELGLPKERAKELRNAIKMAYEEQWAASPNRKDNKANETGQDTHSVAASRALGDLARHPDDMNILAKAYNKVVAAAEAADRQGDAKGAKFWNERQDALIKRINELPKSEQERVLGAVRSNQLKEYRKENTQSLETKEGKTLDVATPEEASEEAVAQTNSIKGGGGKGGSLAGNRHLRIDKIDGDKLTVTAMDAAGKPLGPARQMNRAQWKVLGEAAKINDNIDGDPSNPQKGDMLRMSKGGAGTHDYANDADYQKYLKDHGWNDAEAIRERYEREGAEMAAKHGKLLLHNAEIELHLDREYDPNVDGDGKTIEDPDSGRVVGTFDRKTNKLKLFRGATVKTLVHELGGHATLKYAEQLAAQGDRALLDRINKVIDETPQEVKDDIRKRYTQGKDEPAEAYEARLRDEIWAAIRERNSPAMEKAIKTLQGKAWYSRAWQAFKDAWKGLLSRMGFNRADLSKVDRMSNEEFMKFLDDTMAEGKTLGRLEKNAGGVRNAVAGRQDRTVKEGDDRAYTDAIARGDMDKARDMVREAAEKNGYSTFGLHGTRGEFTVFDKKRIGSANDEGWLGRGFYFWDKSNRLYAEQYANGGKVMEVMLSMEEPYFIGKAEMNKLIDAAEKHDVKTLEDFSKRIKDEGYDSVVDGDGQMLVFEPNQIKSADPVTYDDAGNVIPLSQRFNPTSNDIREARGPAPAGSRILDDIRTKWEKFKEKFLDRFAPVQSVQDEVGGVQEVVGADGYTDHRKSTDFVAAADKANGRVEYEIRDLQHKSDEISKDLAKAALKGESSAELEADFDLYLQCRHAAERNRTIAERNGVTYDPDYYYGMGMIERGGTRVGLSENVANDILADMTRKYGNLDAFDKAAQKVYEINRADIQRRVEAGRLTVQDANQYLYRWNNYVPLKTDMERLEPDAFNSSTATMRRNEFRKARGRADADIADSPLAASILQAEQGIRGSVKNETLNVLANLVRHAEAEGKPIAEIVEGKDMSQGAGWTFEFGDGSKAVAGGEMKLAGNHPEIILFKEDGKLKAIRFEKGANGRGLAVAKSASGENMGRWGSGTEWIPRFTHWMSAMRTQYSPEFTVSNLLADHLEAYQALVGRYGIKGGTATFGRMVASEIQNAKALKNYLKTGMMTADVGEAIRGGLLTKGGVASEGFEGKEQSIRDRIEDFRRKERKWRDMSAADWAKSGWDNVMDFISFANEMAEYSTRMGIFSALKKQGVPVKDAIKFARDATVNFNRKGTAMPLINGLYMFANASVQGAMRSVQAMQDVHGKELVALLVGVGVAKAVIDNYLGNDDEREKAGGRNARNLSEYDRKHNVGVPIPGTDMQFVPLRFRGPYAAIPYLAQTAANVAMGNKSAKDGALTLVRELGDQVTDVVGGNGIMNDKGEFDGSLAMQSIAPSVVDPFVQLATGKDYKGDDRRAKVFDKTTPVSSNGRRSTSEVYKAVAKGLNWLTGGNEFRKGFVDIAPEDLQLVAEFIGGGPMRDVHNTVSTAKNIAQAATGGTPERTLSQTPFLRRIVREYPENTSRYYDAMDAYERDKAEFKKTDMERRREMRKDKPYLALGKGTVDSLSERVKELAHLERGEIKSGQKWVERKTPLTESQKETFRKRRLELQARILKILGE